MQDDQSRAIIGCSCGSVAFEAVGEPIVAAVCYCNDCQEGGRRIEALPDAPAVVDRDGGTQYVLYRKDRVAPVKGEALVEGFKLRDGSPTSRLVATCCNAGMMLRFDRGPHWVTVYRGRIAGGGPPPEIRLNTKSAPAPGDIPDDVPSHRGAPIRFVGKLLASRVAMLLGR